MLGTSLIRKYHMRKFAIEQHVCVRNEVKLEFERIKFWYGNAPFACFIVDFCKNVHSKTKFSVHRLSWMDPHKSKLITRNLGVLAFNPSYSVRKFSQASVLLVRFSDAVLQEHAVN